MGRHSIALLLLRHTLSQLGEPPPPRCVTSDMDDPFIDNLVLIYMCFYIYYYIYIYCLMFILLGEYTVYIENYDVWF